jgi:hypothetical protein
VPLQAVDRRLMHLDLASPYYSKSSANPSTQRAEVTCFQDGESIAT